MPYLNTLMKAKGDLAVDNQQQLCPRCERVFLKQNPSRNALSRRDNKTRICSHCGSREALEDSKLIKHWLDDPKNMPYWDTQSPIWFVQEERMQDEEAGLTDLKEAAWDACPCREHSS